jgi:LPXTG-motif cell wall-anchored protein
MLVAAMLTLAAVAAAQSQDPNQQGAAQPSSATMNAQSTTPAQTPATPTDQPAPPTDASSTTSSSLPKTASPLPLMAVSGLLSLAAGAWLARPRRKA